MDSLNTEETAGVHKIIRATGGHVIHVWPQDRALEASVTPDGQKQLAAIRGIRLITSEPLATTIPARQLIRHTWNTRFQQNIVTRGLDPRGEHDDHPQRAPDLQQTNNSFILRGQKNFYLTSEYMMGSVAVAVVFVESNGRLDRKAEAWTQEDKEDVLVQIQRGLDWWTEVGGYKAGLTWTYEIHSFHTQYEPIQRTKEESSLWIREVMDSLGYRDGEDWTVSREFANDLRDKYATDWAFTIFVAPATNDDDGYFREKSGIAWAYLGGPYMVITNKCNGWGFSQVWKVVAHETGHIFNALDEYAGISSATDRSGRLNVINGNHDIGGTTRFPCLMKNNELTLCEFTSGQIGWVDADSNGVFDSDYLAISRRFDAVRVRREFETWRSGDGGRNATESKILFTENFDHSNGWYEDRFNYVRNGSYHIYDPEYGSSSWLEAPYADFDVSVKTQWIQGSSVSGYGLMYRIFGPNDSYIFFINGDGQFCIGKYVYGNWQYIKDWVRSDAIRLNSGNRLRVHAVRERHTFYINDREVACVEDRTFLNGSIGFAVLPEVHVSFDDLSITKP